MATKRRKVRKTRKRSCKNGKLKKPVKTKNGGKRRCKKRKTKSKSRRRKYKMFQPKGLVQLASRNVADNLTGDIDQRIEQVRTLNLPYITERNIIDKLEKDKQIISEFYYAERENKNNIFIYYIKDNEKNQVKTILKYYPEYVNASRNGNPALLWASRNGHTEIVEMLINAGADVNAKNNDYTTALMDASTKRHTEVVRMLIDAGADVNAKNDFSNTALMIASGYYRNDNPEIVRILIQGGADVNAKNDFGSTALMKASQEGHTEIVSMLIDAGADINAKNDYGSTALTLARNPGHTEIEEILKQAGAR